MSQHAEKPERVSIAIIIGVSDYDSKAIQTLSGCRDDAVAISEIIKSDKKFADHLLLSAHVPAALAKQRIVDFLAKYKGTSIDEVVFYFSGHGDYGVDDFFYLMSDYDPARKRQTALENSELDELLRGVAPRLAVKIVDACHSGVAYVKSHEALRKQLAEKTQAAFQDCYFLFSSLRTQSSFQEAGKLSDFTAAIVAAVQHHPGPQIRYKELIDYLRDTFEHNKDQTPYFVVQGDMSHYFVSVRDDLRARLKALTSAPAPTAPFTKADDLLSLIRDDAVHYATQAETNEFLVQVRTSIENAPLPEKLNEIYEASVAVDPEEQVPSASEIGSWLTKNGGKYFASTQYLTETYTVRVPDVPDSMKEYYSHLTGTLGFTGPNVRLRDESRSRRVVSGFKSTVAIPFNALLVAAEPRYPNVDRVECWVVPIVGQTHVAFFITIVPFQRDGWESHVPSGKVTTLVAEHSLKSSLPGDAVRAILSPFHERVVEGLKARFAAGAGSPDGVVAPALPPKKSSE